MKNKTKISIASVALLPFLTMPLTLHEDVKRENNYIEVTNSEEPTLGDAFMYEGTSKIDYDKANDYDSGNTPPVLSVEDFVEITNIDNSFSFDDVAKFGFNLTGSDNNSVLNVQGTLGTGVADEIYTPVSWEVDPDDGQLKTNTVQYWRNYDDGEIKDEVIITKDSPKCSGGTTHARPFAIAFGAGWGWSNLSPARIAARAAYNQIIDSLNNSDGVNPFNHHEVSYNDLLANTVNSNFEDKFEVSSNVYGNSIKLDYSNSWETDDVYNKPERALHNGRDYSDWLSKTFQGHGNTGGSVNPADGNANARHANSTALLHFEVYAIDKDGEKHELKTKYEIEQSTEPKIAWITREGTIFDEGAGNFTLQLKFVWGNSDNVDTSIYEGMKAYILGDREVIEEVEITPDDLFASGGKVVPLSSNQYNDDELYGALLHHEGSWIQSNEIEVIRHDFIASLDDIIEETELHFMEGEDGHLHNHLQFNSTTFPGSDRQVKENFKGLTASVYEIEKADPVNGKFADTYKPIEEDKPVNHNDLFGETEVIVDLLNNDDDNEYYDFRKTYRVVFKLNGKHHGPECVEVPNIKPNTDLDFIPPPIGAPPIGDQPGDSGPNIGAIILGMIPWWAWLIIAIVIAAILTGIGMWIAWMVEAVRPSSKTRKLHVLKSQDSEYMSLLKEDQKERVLKKAEKIKSKEDKALKKLEKKLEETHNPNKKAKLKIKIVRFKRESEFNQSQALNKYRRIKNIKVYSNAKKEKRLAKHKEIDTRRAKIQYKKASDKMATIKPTKAQKQKWALSRKQAKSNSKAEKIEQSYDKKINESTRKINEYDVRIKQIEAEMKKREASNKQAKERA